MARPDQIERLDRQIAAAVKRAVQDFQQELTLRVRSATSEIARMVEESTLTVPPAFLTAADLEPIEAETQRESRALGSGELLSAARHLDTARTQAGVLTALLEAAGGFSARAAVFLTRGDDVRGWRGDGFGEHGDAAADVARLTFDLGETPWTDLASGTGCVPLSAGDCARITSRLEVPLAQGGALIPLVLRDQVAAALYADRAEDGAWNLEALQILTHLAALAIETLPFRGRAQTPTLVEIGGAGDGLPIWTGELESAAERALAPAAAEQAAEQAAESATVAEAETTPEAWRLHPAPEPVSPWGDPDAEAPAAVPEAAIARKWYDAEEPERIEAEPASADSRAAAAEVAPEPPAVETTDAYWLEEEAAETAAAPTVAAPEPVEVAPATSAPVSEPEAPPLPPPAPWYSPPPPMPPPMPSLPAPMSLATVAIPRPVVEDDVQRPLYGDVDEPTHPGVGTARSQTSPIPIPPPRTWQPGETAEVAAPPDLQGPGWAFASSRTSPAPQGEAVDAALHDEARRLARLLVSEIKLYNEERVEEGRRNRDVYERLKEDIDRSRQMYEERVDPRVMKSTDYFYQELVRILAAGDAKALGI